jgi:hypothetical protein
MHARKFRRMVLATFVMTGCATVFAGCLAIEYAQAQFVNPVPTPPPPTFNPPASSTTVPQAPYTPVAPMTPSTPSGSAPGSYLSESPPSAVKGQLSVAAHSHHRAVHATTAESKVASVSSGRHSKRHRHWSPAVGPSYYPFTIGYIPYSYCTWQREWDGYWAHRCI